MKFSHEIEIPQLIKISELKIAWPGQARIDFMISFESCFQQYSKITFQLLCRIEEWKDRKDLLYEQFQIESIPLQHLKFNKKQSFASSIQEKQVWQVTQLETKSFANLSSSDLNLK